MIMSTRTHCSFSLLTISSLLVFVTVYSQDMGAVYWFKKGINEKDLEKKIEFYQKAVQEQPDFVEAHYNLAMAYLIKKDNNKAETAFKNALSVNPASLNNVLKSNILNRLGSIYHKMGRYAEAEQSFQGALRLTSDNRFKALTLYELGQTTISQGRYNEAIDYFNQGMEISPGDRASFETGIQLAKNGQKIYELYQQGIQLIQSQQLAAAANMFNQILDMDPNHEDAKKQIEKIATLLTQKQDANNQQAQPLYEQAMTYMKDGDWSDAIKYFERLKHVQPNYPNIDNLLAQAQEQQYQQLLKAEKIDKFYRQGVDNFDKGNYAVALVNFEKVAALDSNYKDINLRIQITQRELNRLAELTSNTQSNEASIYEIDDSFQFSTESLSMTAPVDINTSALVTDQSQQIDTTMDSQLLYGYYKEALDLMQNESWQRAVVILEKIKLLNPAYKNTEFLLRQAKQNIEMTGMLVVNQATNTKSSPPSLVLLAFLGGIVIIPLGLIFVSPRTRARYFILLKRYDKAREIYERMLSKKPNNIKWYVTLANIYINENRVDEVAIRIFERAIQYNDNLKMQLGPVVMRYYLQKSKASDTPKNLIQGALKEQLKRMGD